MIINNRLRIDTNNPNRNAAANMLALATMDGNQDCLTVKFEAVNKYFVAIQRFMNKLFGVDLEGKYDLLKIIGKIDNLHSEDNLCGLKLELKNRHGKFKRSQKRIESLESNDSKRNQKKAREKRGKLVQKKLELEAEIKTIGAAQDNLKRMASRLEKKQNHQERAAQLRAVAERFELLITELKELSI